MKKSILIFGVVLAGFVLTAFAYKSWSGNYSPDKVKCNKAVAAIGKLISCNISKAELNLVYNIDNRFMTTVTKEKLNKARSIYDILPEKEKKYKQDYNSVRVAVLNDDSESSEPGESEFLNRAQKKLLRSANYSDNMYIKAKYINREADSGEREDNYLSYYMTIVPEKQAQFQFGKEALIDYLKERTKEDISIIKDDRLKPGQVRFTVTKTGSIENVKLLSTSGYASIDDKLIDLINSMPEAWNPATNSKGELVDQKLVFFFGKQGC